MFFILGTSTIELSTTSLVVSVAALGAGALGYLIKSWMSRTEKSQETTVTKTEERFKDVEKQLTRCQKEHLERDNERLEALHRHDLQLTELGAELKGIKFSLETLHNNQAKQDSKLDQISEETSSGFQVVLQNLETIRRDRHVSNPDR